MEVKPLYIYNLEFIKNQARVFGLRTSYCTLWQLMPDSGPRAEHQVLDASFGCIEHHECRNLP